MTFMVGHWGCIEAQQEPVVWCLSHLQVRGSLNRIFPLDRSVADARIGSGWDGSSHVEHAWFTLQFWLM